MRRLLSAKNSRPATLWPWLLALATAGFLSLELRIPHPASGFDRGAFGELPVLNGGRVKPLDTIARTSLLMLSGKQTAALGGRRVAAIDWLMDVLFRPSAADSVPVFQVDDPDVLGMMGMEQKSQRVYSYNELQRHLDEIAKQAQQAEQIKPDQRSRYQAAIVNLQERMVLYQKLENTLQIAGMDDILPQVRDFVDRLSAAVSRHASNAAHNADPFKALDKSLQQYNFLLQAAEFFPLPTFLERTDRADWVSIGQGAMNAVFSLRNAPPGILAFAAMGDAYRAQDAAAFNRSLEEYKTWLNTQVPAEISRCHYEFIFNHFEPFYKSMLLYLAVFLLAFLSRLLWRDGLDRCAYALLLLAFAVHTLGLVSRMYLQGRPPVTNLYSSAVFVGWMAVLLGITLESWHRNGVGSLVSSTIGCLTLLIAHHLTAQGDTMEMMRAVLDSNFWLATHVTCITIGYSSTFLSGFLAALYIFRRSFDRSWNDRLAETIGSMVYGVVCFSLFFSFVGTILGGIWADQSWGRFWGWDPKENGALMIVLWNSFILHARWGGVARQKTLMALVVFGNIVTALSWFGVNMLGIGLHSYGFMEKAFWWLMVFTASQLGIMGLAFVPARVLKRFRLPTA